MLMAVQKKDGNQEVQGSPRFVQSLTHFFRQEGLAERVICFYLLYMVKEEAIRRENRSHRRCRDDEYPIQLA